MPDCPDCNCSEFDKCLKILNLMLDEESSKEEDAFFFEHIEKCITCFSHYNAEKQVRELLKSKLKRKTIPSKLALEIRNKIVE